MSNPLILENFIVLQNCDHSDPTSGTIKWTNTDRPLIFSLFYYNNMCLKFAYRLFTQRASPEALGNSFEHTTGKQTTRCCVGTDVRMKINMADK